MANKYISSQLRGVELPRVGKTKRLQIKDMDTGIITQSDVLPPVSKLAKLQYASSNFTQSTLAKLGREYLDQRIDQALDAQERYRISKDTPGTFVSLVNESVAQGESRKAAMKSFKGRKDMVKVETTRQRARMVVKQVNKAKREANAKRRGMNIEIVNQ